LNATGLYQRLGYASGEPLDRCTGLGLPGREMYKNLGHRQTRYQQQILAILKQLGIQQDYGIQHKLPIQTPPKQLVDAGKDCFDRPQQLTATTLRAWRKMLNLADSDGIKLEMVSGYRDWRYQTEIIQRKLAKRQSISNILKVSAAPGFSEHHTGRAIDVNTPGCRVLETDFADTDAYDWLTTHAKRFGFIESYPKDNIHGISWEPWHWCFQSNRLI